MRCHLILLIITLGIVLCITPVVLALTFITIDFPGAIATAARGINPEGTIVGEYEDSSFVTHGFQLKNGIFTTIDPPGSIFTEASGINPPGTIVGFFGDSSGGEHGFKAF